jgi:hypothetical protein
VQPGDVGVPSDAPGVRDETGLNGLCRLLFHSLVQRFRTINLIS